VPLYIEKRTLLLQTEDHRGVEGLYSNELPLYRLLELVNCQDEEIRERAKSVLISVISSIDGDKETEFKIYCRLRTSCKRYIIKV
jgi:hypothetical protein